MATAAARHMVVRGTARLLSPGSPEPGEPDPDATRLLLPRRPSYADAANAAVRVRLVLDDDCDRDQPPRGRRRRLTRVAPANHRHLF
ncbi:hypothetical protein [Rhodococcus sp. NCIMB 12038]|uniref:hypothetical protein n=1 Tax=Rhodococcus sp. NCIMB 12038 TaxID=933800 RepID=UPI00211B127A|nr:hypothetical protein [Rhodococcus sp. NCIMB 12038]